jgi:histidinol-phosphate aminotransferase
MATHRRSTIMSVSRRAFVRGVGIGAVTALGGRILGGGRVVGPWTRDFAEALAAAGTGAPLLLHNNENPLGPGAKAIAAMRAKLTERGVPAARYLSLAPELRGAIASKFGCKPDNVTVGCGSTQVLRHVTHAFTSPSRALVAGSPTYEECTDYAALIGAPVRAVPLTRSLHLDLDAMAAASKGAGMVFLNNPNNPTATVHSAAMVTAFVERVLRDSPETTIVIDEAYHEYVTDPSYATQIPLALDNPRVVVARTFSKAYGMAGLRIGFAVGRAETIARIRENQYDQGASVLSLAAALASIDDEARMAEERRRNTEARQFTIDWFRKAGFGSTDSQCNFIFVDVGRPAKAFREACRESGVIVGRDFPPFEKSHVRISIGTIDEMKRAVDVFGTVLRARAAAA